MRVAVFGGGGHARVVLDALGRMGEGYHVTACVTLEEDQGATLFGVPLVSEEMFRANPDCDGVVVAIGNGMIRDKIVSRLKDLFPEMVFPAVVDPTALVSQHAMIGEGAQVLAGAIVNASASVGCFAIVNTAAVVEHECVIGDYAFIAPHATILGGASVEAQAVVGAGACVAVGIRVSRRAGVAAGAVVRQDVAEDMVVGGVPARILRGREEHEALL